MRIRQLSHPKTHVIFLRKAHSPLLSVCLLSKEWKERIGRFVFFSTSVIFYVSFYIAMSILRMQILKR